jgi:hypothetical protein
VVLELDVVGHHSSIARGDGIDHLQGRHRGDNNNKKINAEERENKNNNNDLIKEDSEKN